jgi:hypothetical protein
VGENATPRIVNPARNACAAGIFVIHARHGKRIIDIIATHHRQMKARCADSESRVLATKKFSRSPASRRIVARQNRFFARIAAADSQGENFASRVRSRLW